MPRHFFEFIPVYKKLKKCLKMGDTPFNSDIIENSELKQQFIEILSNTNETPETAREKEIGLRYHPHT